MAKKRTVNAGKKRVAQFEQYARNQEDYFANQKKELEKSIKDLKTKADELNLARVIWKGATYVSSGTAIALWLYINGVIG